jgi:hypothetical protein
MKAVICYLRRSVGPTGFGECVRDLAVYDFMNGDRMFEDRWLTQAWPPYPNTGRNRLTEAALKLPPELSQVIFWLDDDEAFQPWQPAAIVRCIDPVTRPVVSGLYFAHNGEERARARPVILKRNAAGRMKAQWDYPPNELMEVDSVGMGFTAIARPWLEKWQAQHGPTWFDYRGTGAASPGGFRLEDAAFCERVQETGGRVMLHTGIKLRHLKVVEIGETHYLRERGEVAPSVPEAMT